MFIRVPGTRTVWPWSHLNRLNLGGPNRLNLDGLSRLNLGGPNRLNLGRLSRLSLGGPNRLCLGPNRLSLGRPNRLNLDGLRPLTRGHGAPPTLTLGAALGLALPAIAPAHPYRLLDHRDKGPDNNIPKFGHHSPKSPICHPFVAVGLLAGRTLDAGAGGTRAPHPGPILAQAAGQNHR